jgi:hypothetical protein
VPGVWVSRDILGVSLQLDQGQDRVTVEFPRAVDDFVGDPKEPEVWAPASGAGGDPRPPLEIPIHEYDYVTVRVLRVVVETDEVGFGSSDFEAADEETLKDLTRRATIAARLAREAARRAVNEVVAWLRAVWGQGWLGLSSDLPEDLGDPVAVDAATGGVIPLKLWPVAWIRTRPTTRALRRDEVAELVTAIQSEESDPPLAETLLADAHFLAYERDPPDPVRAVLMAAIALEVKVKRNLVERARDDQLALIDFALSNQREIIISAAGGLFDKFMKASQGRSLREDAKELFRLVDKLFTLRNRIAHAGTLPTRQEAEEAADAAEAAFWWLDHSPAEEPWGPAA